MPSRLPGPPWVGGEEFIVLREHDQLVDKPWIGWCQGGVSSVINLLVLAQSRVYVLVVSSFILEAGSRGGGSAPCKTS